MSSAADCCFSMCQSPLMAILRPAMWVPGIKKLHSATETWIIPNAPVDVCIDKLLEAIDSLGEKEKMHVNKVNRDRGFVQIFSFTPNEWFDVVEIEFKPGREQGAMGHARSFSTGLLPTCCPLALLFNVIFFFVPFHDQGTNKARLDRVRGQMTLEIAVEDVNVHVP
ncbi:uncharacterized protein LOC5511578 [Nematostella vectensis]|uniref:uncharacterized protein LOC5511578 n=1 Tax=Nematostella vectensis TaxID=45351 RepID=UPI00139019C3|nr:uncharacterized protein LOC5511578 [Nematostella vectensis]